MLSIGVMAQGQSAYYIGLAREDYYIDGGEPPGIWHGQGAEALGLVGQVDGSHLTRAFEGFHPVRDGALVELQKEKGHRPGWDLTFSAPKSVSVLWSQADPETRGAIQSAQFAAVKVALDYLESSCEVARRGKGGYEHECGKMLYATFEHGTSRAQDPQLHTHALLLNIVQRQDGTFGTLDAQDVFKSKMLAGAIYRAELAYQLEQSIGIEVKRDGIYFEVAGVPKSLCDALSKRRAEIEAVLEEKGWDSPEASAFAALSTRSVKGHVPREELFENWHAFGTAQGWSQPQTYAVIGKPLPERNPEEQLHQALHEVQGRVTEQSSTFTEREFLRRMVEAAPGRGIRAGDALSHAQKQLQDSPEVVYLGEKRSDSVFTTREMLALEKRVFDAVATSEHAPSCGVRESVLEGIIASRKQFSEEQSKALRHIAQENGGSIRVVSGMAGTGKTTLLHAARMSWEMEGFEVRGACISGKAAEGLEEGSGIASETIHRTLWDLQNGQLRLQEKSVLVVDEAGMVGTRSMEKLMTFTQAAGATLILVGDEKQLQSIEAGGIFAEVGRQLESATLTDIRRQRDDWARTAVKDFAYGRADRGLAAYAQRGLLHIKEDMKETRATLIDQWKVGGIHAPEDQLIFTGTRNDCVILNRMAQAERKQAGTLSQESLFVAGDHFHVGDRILFTKNSKSLDVRNGSMGEVVELDSDKKLLVVRLDKGERVRFSLEDYEHLQLGYAVTSHKGQGATVERAYILAGGSMQDREISYVQASRSRGETQIFSDRENAGEKVEQLVRQMAHSRAKETAHATRERLQLEADLAGKERDSRTTHNTRQTMDF